jgi:O-acetylserine/cysteine efflux transporter
MKPVHLLAMLAIDLIWGFNYVAAKHGVTHIPPMWFAALRFLALAIFLSPWLRWQAGRMWQVAVVAICAGALHFSLIFAGLRLADDVSVVAILTQLGVPIATLLGVAFLGERIRWRRTLGIVLAFGGVLIIGLDTRVLGYIGAVGLVVLSQISAAIGLVVMRRLTDVPVFTLQAWLGAVSAPALFLISLAVEDGQVVAMQTAPWSAWGALAFTVFLTSLVGHGGLNWMLQRYPINIVMPMTLLSTLFGVLFGVWLYGDQISARFIVGGAVTLAGVLIIILRQPEIATPTA